MKVYNCEQLSPEWFAAKLGKLSASHFSDVLNKRSGYKTYQYRLLGERLSGVSYEAYSNKAMDRGSEVEHQAKEYYEALYGKVILVGFVELSDYIGCSPDGMVDPDGLIEIKCPFPSTHVKYIVENKLPANYKPQVQGQLWVTGAKWCDFISYDPRVESRPFWKLRVFRDEKYIETLSKAIDKFVEELKAIEDLIANKDKDF